MQTSKPDLSENDAHARYEYHLDAGKTVKQAVTAAAKDLDMPRRRINDWRKRRNWRTQPREETKKHLIRRLAKEAQVSEKVMENALLIDELEAAAEIPEGTKASIIAGTTTARKVLFAYRKKKGLLPLKEKLRTVSIRLTDLEIEAIQDIRTAGDDPLSTIVRKLQDAL